MKPLWRAIRSLVSLGIVVLSWVVPKRNELLVFNGMKQLRGNTLALLSHLTHVSEYYQPVLIAKSRSEQKQLADRGFRALPYFSVRGVWSIVRARYIIFDAKVSLLEKPFVPCANLHLVETWHGTGFKNIRLAQPRTGWSPFKWLRKAELGHYAAVLATSSEDQIRKQKSFNNPRVYITGSPENDQLLTPDSAPELRGSKAWVKHYQQVLLYAPTFRDKDRKTFAPLSVEFWQRLNEAFASSGQLLLVKVHPIDKSRFVPAGLNNVWEISDESVETNQLLPHIDGLITDYSGITSDFVLTDRPIIFYMHDYADYLVRNRTFYYDLKLTLPGPFIDNENDLLACLTQDFAWFSEPTYQHRFQAFKTRFHRYDDDQSCRRVEALLRSDITRHHKNSAFLE